MTPTVLRDGPYVFRFYSSDASEPPHVHVRRDECEAKLWLVPVRVEWSRGFAAAELRRVVRLVEEHEPVLMVRWYDYFSESDGD